MYNIIQLHSNDNIGIAPMSIPKDVKINSSLVSRNHIPYGHKVSLVKIQKDSLIYKYGQIIGKSTHEILPGEHVHSHNLEFSDFERVKKTIKKKNIILQKIKNFFLMDIKKAIIHQEHVIT